MFGFRADSAIYYAVVYQMPKNSYWDISLVTPPWGERQSIYQHLLAHCSPNLGLIEDGEKLPDEHIVSPPGKMQWVAGALDNICNRADSSDVSAEKIYFILEALASEATDAQAEILYSIVVQQSVISYVDQLLRLIGERYILPNDKSQII